MLRRGGAIEHGRKNGGEVTRLFRRRGLEVAGHREQVVETRGIDERDLRAALGRLAHAVRQHRRLAAQVRTHDQQSIELVDGRDGEATQARGRRIGVLVAEIQLAQAMVDVGRAQRTRQAAE